MSSRASGWLLIRAQNTSSPPPICRSAGQKLISMLMVLTNVLRWGCHFWADLNCRPELNCSVNYHIIAFSAVIYLHVEAGALQLVGRGVCAAGLTQTLQDVSPLANISLHPPPHTHFYFSQLVSFYSHFFSYFLFIFYLFLFIHLLTAFFFFHFPLMLSFSPLYFLSSIFCLSSIWRGWQWGTLRVIQYLSFTEHTHTGTQTQTHICSSQSFSFLYLSIWHFLSPSLHL